MASIPEAVKFIGQGLVSNLVEKLADYISSTAARTSNYNNIFAELKKRITLLIAKASDVDCEIRCGEQNGKKPKGFVLHWLSHVIELISEFTGLVEKLESESSGTRFIDKLFEGNKLSKLSDRAQELLNDSQHFGDELLLNVYEARRVPFSSRRLVGEKYEKVWNLLVDDTVSSIGIHGMGGVGKTFLAKYIHDRILETQECVIWIKVSKEFNIRNLQDEIARAIHLDLSHEQNEDIRAARLRSKLDKMNKFVLILDDVWKNINLEKLGNPLSVKGGKLIVTTRLTDVLHVYKQIGCHKVVRVETLNDYEALNLFEEIIGESMASIPQIQRIAECMVKRCGGLPLGIITIAKNMKGVSDIQEWNRALENLHETIMSEDNEEEGVFKILKYSFDQLGQGEKKYNEYTMLQHCFLHCCLYPRNYPIPKQELVSQFISEGWLDKRKSRGEQEVQCHRALNRLVSVCLLESHSTWGVKMNDLVRDMALKITKGKYLIVDEDPCCLETILNEEHVMSLEKISLIGNVDKYIPNRWTPNCPKLSAQLLRETESLAVEPSSFFLKMPHLRVLNLSRTRIEKLPDSLSELGSLGALLLSSCMPLECVPGCLLLKFQNLHCLHLPFHIEAPVEEIESLKQLQEFRGRVKDVPNFNKLMRSPARSEYIQSYKVVVGEYCDPTKKLEPWHGKWDPTRQLEPWHDKHVGMGIIFSYDREVFFCGTDLNESGSEDEIILEPDSLTFFKCMGLSNCLFEDLTRFRIALKSLKCLRIGDCRGTECIVKHEQFLEVAGESECPFQKLEEIDFHGLREFTGVIKFRRQGEEVASSPNTQPIFSSLKSLEIQQCNKMERLGLPPWELKNLELISVGQCSKLKEIMPIEDEHREDNAVQLPKLERLKLWELPGLYIICNATVVCNSLQEIRMQRCTKLKKLPLIFGESNCQSGTLRTISIPESELGWWKELKLEHTSLHGVLQQFLQH